jgi:hypothetical protein
MKEALMDLLPWYVNGTLSTEETKLVDQYLEQYPAYRQQLAFLEALQKEVQDNIPRSAPDLGLTSTLVKIEMHSNLGRDQLSRVKPVENWFDRLFSGGFQFRPAYALGIAIIFMQTALIGYLIPDGVESYSQVRATRIVPPSVGPFIKVSFRPDAKESDIRFLMIQLGASIVGGPSQLGDYYLFLNPSRTDWAAQQLRKSPMVDSVNVIATLPVAKE